MTRDERLAEEDVAFVSLCPTVGPWCQAISWQEKEAEEPEGEGYEAS